MRRAPSAALLAGAVLLAGPAWAADAPPGASSCTGCHAAQPVANSAIPRLAGRPAEEVVRIMGEYRSGAWASSIMGRIAKGFDEAQIAAIAAWFAAQPR